MGGGNDNESTDKGLLSYLAGFASGHYLPHGSYPPQGYPPQPYPPQGYPPASYPPPGTYPPAGYVPSGGYPSACCPGPSAPCHSGHGPSMGALLAWGAAPAAASCGAHHLSHGAHHHCHGGYFGHGRFKHGRRWQHGMFGKHCGKFF